MKKPKRILVGVKDINSTLELGDAACRLAAPGASVLFIHVLELPDATPIEAEVPELEAPALRALRAGERLAIRAGLKPSTLILHARSAGDALVEQMTQKKIDLAVLGYHHKRTLGERLLGTTASHVMKRAPCRVLLSIPPRKPR